MDCEIPEFCAERWVAARKEHACCECGHPIVTGERHQAVSGKWHGGVATYRTCECCAKARCALTEKWAVGDCVPFGHLSDELSQYESQYGPLMPIVEAARSL